MAGLPSGTGVSRSAGRRPVPRTLGHRGASGPARGGPAEAVLSAAWRGPAGPWNPGSAEPWAPLRWRGPRGAPGTRAPFGCPVARDARSLSGAQRGRLLPAHPGSTVSFRCFLFFSFFKGSGTLNTSFFFCGRCIYQQVSLHNKRCTVRNNAFRGSCSPLPSIGRISRTGRHAYPLAAAGAAGSR